MPTHTYAVTPGLAHLFCREDAEALGLVVDTVAGHGNPSKRALVVLSFEAEVALDHDDDWRMREYFSTANSGYVLLHHCKLLFGLCM